MAIPPDPGYKVAGPQPKASKPMRMEIPNYSKRSPIVNDNNFVDGHPPVPSPTLGSPQATFNPGAKSGLPAPPRFISPPGKRVSGAKGMSQKRQTDNL
jgi:membrane-associated protease RseP (regulator of RpoE activity)